RPSRRDGWHNCARMAFPLSRAWLSIEAALFPSRLAALRVLLLAFVLSNALVRLALAAFNGEPSFFLPWRIVPALLIGALFDLGAATFLLVPFAALLARYKEFSADAQLNELAGNGYYDFWHAFRTNEIDYERFYRTLPVERAAQVLAHELDPARPAAEVSRLPFERTIAARGPERRLNVVLIS